MSCSEPRRAGRDRRRLLLGLAAASALGGCGFRPLHGGGGADPVVGRVRVVPPPGRAGYYFQRALSRRLGAAGEEPRYTLSTTLRFDRRETAITVEADVTRYDVLGAAAFRLVPAGAAEPTLEETVRAVSAYTTLAAPYATAIAERDARRRVSEELARKVHAAVAVALSAEAGRAERDGGA